MLCPAIKPILVSASDSPAMKLRQTHFDLKYKALEAYQLLLAEADQGDDIGNDEFASFEHFNSLLGTSDSYALNDPVSGTLKAFLTLTPSVYSRMEEPVLVDGLIVCDQAIKTNVLTFLIQTAIDMASKGGYQGLIMNSFRTSKLKERLQELGFIVVGCVPNSGRLKNRGWTDSFILYHELERNITCTGTDESSHTPITNHSNGILDVYLHYKSQRQRLSYLPRKFAISNGDEILIRYMEQSDYQTIYLMYKEASKAGDGYSKDEFSTFNNFLYYVVDHGHAFIAEDAKTARILGAFTLTPGSIFRSVDPTATDAFLLVHPQCKRQALGSDLSCILTRFCKDLGYTGACGDAFAGNVAMLRIIRHQGFNIVGCVPNAAIGTGNKLENLVIFYKSLEDQEKYVAKL